MLGSQVQVPLLLPSFLDVKEMHVGYCHLYQDVNYDNQYGIGGVEVRHPRFCYCHLNQDVKIDAVREWWNW